MSRQSSFMLRLPLLTGLKASSNLEARFALAESQQWDAFHASMSEHQQEFAEDEKSQWAGESMRISEFDRMMANIGTTFNANEKRRDGLFLEVETRQEEIFRGHEKVREEVFSDGESSRASFFHQDQDRRDKRAEWYATIRETHFREGRMAREVICQDLEKALIKQFDDTLRGQEDAFLSEERQRDELVKKLVDDEHTQAAPTGLVNSVQPFHDPISEEQDFTSIVVPLTPPFAPVGPSNDPHSPSGLTMPFLGSGDIPKLPAPHELQTSDDDDTAPARSAEIRPMDSPDTDYLRPTGYTIPEPIAEPIIIPYPSRRSRSPSTRRSPSLSRHHSRSRSPRPWYRPRSPDQSPRSRSRSPQYVTAIPSPSLYMPTIVPSSRPSIAPIIVHQDSSGSPIASKSESPVTIGNHFEERFQYSEEQRQQSFMNDEESRQMRFEEAEATRDEGESSRRNLFERKTKSFALKFRIMMAAHEQRFEGREDTRARGEARRSQQAEAGVTRRAHMFDQAISHIQKHFTAGDNLEYEIFNFMKRKVEMLDRKQRAILAAARDQQAARFEKSQARRAKDLKTRLPSGRSSRVFESEYFQSVPSEASSEALRSRRSRSHRYNRGGPSPMIVVRPSSHAPVYSPRIYSRSRSRSPATGFAPGAIFKGTNFQTSLPTPSGEVRKSREETFQDFQRRRRYIFETSQAKRDAAFESGAQRRRRAFSLKEARRQAQFEKMVKDGKEKFDEEEDERERIFRQAQNERERKFSDKESSRESAFRDAEQTRTADFIRAQEQRDESFHSKQEALRKACFESEEQRLLHMGNWASELLKEREQHQANDYRLRAMYRDQQFNRSLKYSVLKSAIRRRLEEGEEQ